MPTTGLLAREDVRTWVDAIAARLVVPREEIARIVADAQIVPEVQRLILPTPTPAKPRTWKGYRARFLDPVRIDGGLAFWNAHAQTLERASQRYGVAPEIIIAIAGIETVYGRLQGNFRIVDALATLGFAWPAQAPRDRSEYFREQLAQFIALSWERDLDPLAVRGSYAGAIGIPQFMPGSIREFAVDFDEDGRIDLRNDADDAIGSIANFLAAHGWHGKWPVAVAAQAPARSVEGYIAHDLVARYGFDELAAAGIRCNADDVLVHATDAPRWGLVDLDSPDAPTEYRCASANFFAIAQYNRSFFYAAAVMDLASALRQAHDHPRPQKKRRKHRSA